MSDVMVRKLIAKFGPELADVPHYDPRTQFTVSDMKVALPATASDKEWDHARVKAYVDAAIAFEEEIDGLSADELRRRSAEERKLEAGQLAKSAAIEDQWRFFAQPEATANLDKWAKLVPWTIDQAIALTFGKNPDVVNIQSLEADVPSSDRSPFVVEYRERTALLKAAVFRSDVSEHIYPNSLVRWAKEAPIDVDPGLRRLAARASFRHDVSDVESENDPTGSTWRAVVLGMLLAYYDFPLSYDPKTGEKTGHVTRVKDDLAEVGIKLSDKPIREALAAVAAWGRDPKNEVKFVSKKLDLWREKEARHRKPVRRKTAP